MECLLVCLKCDCLIACGLLHNRASTLVGVSSFLESVRVTYGADWFNVCYHLLQMTFDLLNHHLLVLFCIQVVAGEGKSLENRHLLM